MRKINLWSQDAGERKKNRDGVNFTVPNSRSNKCINLYAMGKINGNWTVIIRAKQSIIKHKHLYTLHCFWRAFNHRFFHDKCRLCRRVVCGVFRACRMKTRYVQMCLRWDFSWFMRSLRRTRCVSGKNFNPIKLTSSVMRTPVGNIKRYIGRKCSVTFVRKQLITKRLVNMIQRDRAIAVVTCWTEFFRL